MGAVPSPISRMTDVGRKAPVHAPVRERHNTPIIVFLTVCTKDRKKMLANEDAHELLVSSWRAATSWLVGRYVIMPDHVHLFCAPTELEARPLIPWVSYWKSLAARNWPDAGAVPIWQRHFWDTQLRRDESSTRNGNTSSRTPCVMAWSEESAIGHIKEC
jgi:putative transposase